MTLKEELIQLRSQITVLIDSLTAEASGQECAPPQQSEEDQLEINQALEPLPPRARQAIYRLGVTDGTKEGMLLRLSKIPEKKYYGLKNCSKITVDAIRAWLKSHGHIMPIGYGGQQHD